MKKINVDFARSFFPALKGDWAFMDNAGGTQVPQQVVDRISDYLINSNVQLGASYQISELAGERVLEARKAWKEMISANDDREVIFGSSTSQLLQNLSKAFSKQLKAGDEIIVTNSDHEANIGPWRSLEEQGVVIREWKVNPDNLQLELDDLKKLFSDKTRLLAFTHVSNLLGTINPVKEITSFAHQRGALVCVDGVAYAPHRKIDVQEWDVDFYVFSMYKVYGPHYALLYGKKDIITGLPGINHYFIGNEQLPYNLQPGNVNFELTYGLLGIIDYFNEFYFHHFGKQNANIESVSRYNFDLFSQHEEELSKILIEFLKSKRGVRIIGSEAYEKVKRVSTISFVAEGMLSSDIVRQVDPHHIAIRFGDFYALRLATYLDLLKHNGVVRVSLVHYNTIDEVYKLIGVLDEILR